MNNKKYIDEIFQILYDYIKKNDRVLSENEIYNYLTRFGVSENTYGSSITDIRKNIVQYVESYIYKMSSSTAEKTSDLKRYRIKDQGSNGNVAFTHMNVSFKNNIEAPSRDIIKLYIPLNAEGLEYDLKLLYNYLFENKINFQSKVSDDIRCDLFVLRVDNKEDAFKIIDFCNSVPSIKGNIGFSNPFIPVKNGIGMSKDTYGLSYNTFLSSVIREYFDHSFRNNVDKCNFTLFQQFIDLEEKKYSESKTLKGSKHHFLYKTLCDNVRAIKEKSLPCYLMDDNHLEYNHSLFCKFKRYMDEEKNYQYKDLQTGKFVSQESEQWLELQAMNFLAKLYEQYNKKAPEENFTVNNELSSYCLSIIDMYKDGNMKPNPATYHDPKIDNLYPYFYSYLAMMRRDASVEDALNISSVIKETMIKTNDRQEKEYKNISFVSNIPIINIGDASIGIELLDSNDPNVKGLCNISVIKNGTITKYNNVFVDLDYTLLYPNYQNQDFAMKYRASIGHLLSDLERNKRMMNTRDGHFGVLKYDDQNGVKKFQNPEYISKMAQYRQEGKVPDKFLEEGTMTK